MDLVDTSRNSQGARSSDLPGPEVFKASFGGGPFRYPSAIEILSSHLLQPAMTRPAASRVEASL